QSSAFHEFHYYHNISSLLLWVSYILSIILSHFVLKYSVLKFRGLSIACVGTLIEMSYNLGAGCCCFVLTKPYFNLLIIFISSSWVCIASKCLLLPRPI